MDRLSLLFEPCETIHELKQHIRAFLNIDLPDVTIDEDSTSNPMQFVWDVYNTMLTNGGYTSHVAACSRNTAKTLTSAILHFYAMIHFRRTCLQLAATLDQSVSCLKYLDKFLSIPEIKPFSNIDNARTKALTNMPANKMTSKADAEIRVAVATKKGTNSQRCNFLVCDEVDLTPQEILDEVIFVVDPVRYNQFEPVVVWLSSRKSNSGPVQKLIDDSEDPTKDIRLHKWSVADWMRKCPTETHKPDLPRKKALLNVDTLQVIWDEEQIQNQNTQFKTNLKEIDAYAGCETCPAFIVCQARAPKQTSRSNMLRTIKFVGGVLKKVKDVNIIVSQYLNLKPETTGIVFKTFSKTKHARTAVDFYHWTTGRLFNPHNLSDEEFKDCLTSKSWAKKQKITPTKDDIYHAMCAAGWDFSFGVDYGFSPAPAVCIVAAFHKKSQRAVVLHVEYANGYDNRAWSEYVSTNIWPRFAGNFIAPDMEDPAAPSYFGKFRIPTINTKPHQIETGVSQLRGFLWNVALQRTCFAVLDDMVEDGGNRRLIEAFEKWTHKRTPLGFNFDRYEDDDFCDFIDPTRYAFAPYVKEIMVSIAAKQPSNNPLDRYRAEMINRLPPEKRAEAVQALARHQLDKFFKDNHGLEKIFDKEDQAKQWREVQDLNARLGVGSSQESSPNDAGDGLKHQRKSGIKMSF